MACHTNHTLLFSTINNLKVPYGINNFSNLHQPRDHRSPNLLGVRVVKNPHQMPSAFVCHPSVPHRQSPKKVQSSR
jgi:hypothetical protein